MAWMFAWHMSMLRHNLGFWIRVPEEARSVCADFARTAAAVDGQAVVGGLPQKKDGVVFLANGFPECVAMNKRVVIMIDDDSRTTTLEPIFIVSLEELKLPPKRGNGEHKKKPKN